MRLDLHFVGIFSSIFMLIASNSIQYLLYVGACFVSSEFCRKKEQRHRERRVVLK